APVDLLLHGAVHRRVAGVQAHDASVVAVPFVDGEHVFERHGGGVVHLDIGAAVVEQGGGNQRRRPDHHAGLGQAVAPPQGDEVGRPRAGTDERDHAGPGGGTGGTITVAR